MASAPTLEAQRVAQDQIHDGYSDARIEQTIGCSHMRCESSYPGRLIAQRFAPWMLPLLVRFVMVAVMAVW
jgi:hypothetical protein